MVPSDVHPRSGSIRESTFQWKMEDNSHESSKKKSSRGSLSRSNTTQVSSGNGSQEQDESSNMIYVKVPITEGALYNVGEFEKAVQQMTDQGFESSNWERYERMVKCTSTSPLSTTLRKFQRDSRATKALWEFYVETAFDHLIAHKIIPASIPIKVATISTVENTLGNHPKRSKQFRIWTEILVDIRSSETQTTVNGIYQILSLQLESTENELFYMKNGSEPRKYRDEFLRKREEVFKVAGPSLGAISLGVPDIEQVTKPLRCYARHL
ncbi:hypothetical protein QFC19_003747 [Naganishia cerealis]|uniref:Uncharacterized protein n=1 Tax=Naganishia cerealis TaxID=610337 RepID=A0ACC2W1J2_9TREE|nr:hypothetical protein QFC19_003747 [Naganishia cerealis]